MKTLRFIYSETTSRCCQARELLVRSRDGGFVSRNCLKCGVPGYVKKENIPTIDCECCGVQLKVEELDGRNYFYKCFKCGRTWKLADCLPKWSELFEHFGLPAPGDPTWQ